LYSIFNYYEDNSFINPSLYSGYAEDIAVWAYVIEKPSKTMYLGLLISIMLSVIALKVKRTGNQE
jgi:hypothetical protein